MVVLLLCSNCQKEIIENLSTTPEISFHSYTRILSSKDKDSLLKIKINFSDADGDIGLNDEDQDYPFRFQDPYFYNLTLEYFELEEGTLTPYLFLGKPYIASYRIAPILPQGKDKRLVGELEVTIQPNFGGGKSDSLTFAVTLVDRATNKSNRMWTPVINLTH